MKTRYRRHAFVRFVGEEPAHLFDEGAPAGVLGLQDMVPAFQRQKPTTGNPPGQVPPGLERHHGVALDMCRQDRTPHLREQIADIDFVKSAPQPRRRGPIRCQALQFVPPGDLIRCIRRRQQAGEHLPKGAGSPGPADFDHARQRLGLLDPIPGHALREGPVRIGIVEHQVRDPFGVPHRVEHRDGRALADARLPRRAPRLPVSAHSRPCRTGRNRECQNAPACDCASTPAASDAIPGCPNHARYGSSNRPRGAAACPARRLRRRCAHRPLWCRTRSAASYE